MPLLVTPWDLAGEAGTEEVEVDDEVVVEKEDDEDVGSAEEVVAEVKVDLVDVGASEMPAEEDEGDTADDKDINGVAFASSLLFTTAGTFSS